jgi:hypothetical protein
MSALKIPTKAESQKHRNAESRNKSDEGLAATIIGDFCLST